MTAHSHSNNIEAVHRGFLYQHLFAVGILLSPHAHTIQEVTVEDDEDIELFFFSNTRRYIQIKTRSTVLRPADIATTLSRFLRLAGEHERGERTGAPEFMIASNAPLVPQAHHAIMDSGVTVIVLEPNTEDALDTPPAWSTLEEAIAWCVDAASNVPFGTLRPETLVWKLATEIAVACTGSRKAGHSFRPAELADLLEQLVTRLHRFPSPPSPYLSLDNEPPLVTIARIRLIIGFSGAGKTAWAAQGNLHSEANGIYVNATDVSDSALPSTVTREICAALLNAGVDEARGAVLPGVQSYEALRFLSEVIARDDQRFTLVIDNVHRMDVETVQHIVEAIPSCRFVLLAQPWPAAPALEAALDLESEQLPGYSLESIAAIFRLRGGGVDVNTADRVLRLTGGLPLFVRDAALLMEKYYENNAARLCDDLEGATNATTTGQEVILGQVAHRLSKSAQDVLALLALSELPLSQNETITIIGDTLGTEPAEGAVLLRELSAWGITQRFGDGSLRVHDAFSILAYQFRAAISQETLLAGRRSLARVLRSSFKPGKYERLVMFLKLAPLIGETEAVVDIVSGLGEHLQELGKAADLLRIVDEAADDPTISPSDRFWAADAALFWTLDGYSVKDVDRRVAKLKATFAALDNPADHVRSAFLLKQLLIAGRHGRLPDVYRIYRDLRTLTDGDGTLDRIVRYDYASELYRCDATKAAYYVLAGLVGDYFHAVGLSPGNLFMKNPSEIAELLKDGTDPDELKRLADVLDLLSRVVNELGASSGVLRIWAHKLYLLASAYRSAVKVGQDVVDELLYFADVATARQMIEQTLIPLIRKLRLLAYLIPVQAQHAVVLAYAGEHAKADALLDQLVTFQTLSTDRKLELRNQRELVQRIKPGFPIWLWYRIGRPVAAP